MIRTRTPQRDGLGDLEGLLLREREPAGGLTDVEADPEPIEHGLGVAVHLPSIDHADPGHGAR
ncbi:MAG: hypothetical protein WKF78_02135 [Candidatus Limnocylindrales bacterium]